MKIFQIIKEQQEIEEKYRKVALNDITNPYKNIGDFLKGLKDISGENYEIIKKYINWILQRYTTRFILTFSSLKDVLKYLIKYDELKSKNILPHIYDNIDNIKGETDLKSIVKYQEEILKKSKDEEDIVFHQSNVKIVKPLSFLTFKRYTSDMNLQNFYVNENDFKNNDDLYILIDEHKKNKYVLKFTSRKFLDKNGKNVNIFQLIKNYPYLKEIFKKHNPNFKFFDEENFDLSEASLKTIIYLYNNKKIDIDDIIKHAKYSSSAPMQFLVNYLDIDDNVIIYLRNKMNDEQFKTFLYDLPKEKIKKLSDIIIKKILINPKFFSSMLYKIEDKNFIINVINNTSENNFINLVSENILFFINENNKEIIENISEERKKIIEKIIKEKFSSDPQETIDILATTKRYDLIDKLFTKNEINVFFKTNPLRALNMMEHWSIPSKYKNSYIFSDEAGKILYEEVIKQIKSMGKLKKYDKEELQRLRNIYFRIYKKKDYFDRIGYEWYEENPNLL